MTQVTQAQLADGGQGHRLGPLARLFEPVDAASLAGFRIAFGVLAAVEAYSSVSRGQARELWVKPSLLLPAPGFGWLEPWPGDGIYLHLYALVGLGLATALGCFHRVACALLALGWLYLLALCQTGFGHGPYLIALLAALLAVAPAHRTLSLDAWLRPRVRADGVPRWALWLPRFQVGVVLAAAGIGMLASDWRHGYPLRLRLPEHQGLPLLGWIHGEPAVAIGLSWLLLGVHLTAVPALCWPRSRALALGAIAACYAWLQQTFGVGTFPFLVIAGTLLYLPPDWPRRVFELPAPGLRGAPAPFHWSVRRRAGATAALVWVALQVLLPLRGLVAPVDAAWTERGQPFAWRVLQWAKAGTVYLEVRDGERRWRVDPERDLTAHQARIVAADPGVLRDYARRVARREARPGQPVPEVRAFTLVTLNGREPQRLVDPDRDLAAAPRPLLRTPDWILPLEIPLERQWQATGAAP